MLTRIGVRRVFDTDRRLRIDWDIAWKAWFVGTLSSFAVLETLAFRRGTFPTLSATLRNWLGVHPRRRSGRIAPLIFAAFWLWLAAHVGRAPQDRTGDCTLQNDFKTVRGCKAARRCEVEV